MLAKLEIEHGRTEEAWTLVERWWAGMGSVPTIEAGGNGPEYYSGDFHTPGGDR